ncbi:MAG: cell division protein FtsA [Caldimicrobium sp.]|jgi:cell division protein FtsA|nr:cell division protein FtsA [Caldimicrobium sp.]
MSGGAYLVVDVGTTKVCALVGELKGNEQWVTGIGVVPSSGLKKGTIIHLEEATLSIKQAIEKALAQAKQTPQVVLASIAGSHVKTWTGMGVVVLKNREVTPEDVEEVIQAAQSIDLPQDQMILHVIPQEFVVDNLRGVQQPIGMSGVRLEAHVQLITAQRSQVQNLLRCFENLGIEVSAVLYQGLASAEAVLTPEEKDLGVLIIDLGGGTTDFAVIQENVLKYVGSIPVGGENLTNDLAIGLRTTKTEAERIKIEKGVCLRELVDEQEEVEVPGVGARPSRRISRKVLAEILELRMREILELIDQNISKHIDKSLLTGGAVLTGGSALLPGLIYLTDQILDLPTRIGYPVKLKGLGEEINHPQFATAVGMLVYAFQNYQVEETKTFKGKGILQKLKEWIKGF